MLPFNTGEWTRVLPAGDPGNTGKPAFPSPRQGAVAVSFNEALVGSARSIASDTLVFGGEDASGNYLSEVWILRAYNAIISSTNESWSGFGNGELQTGVNANGQGVTNQYMTECASAIASAPTSSSSSKGSTSGKNSPTATHSSSSPFSTSPPSTGPSSLSSNPYDTSIMHKSLAAVSVALFLPSVALFRLSLPHIGPPSPPSLRSPLFVCSILGGMIAYILGIIGLATSFSSITTTAFVVKRSSSSIDLKTAHGKAGLALFACFYGLLPIVYALSVCSNAYRSRGDHMPVEKDEVGSRLDTNGTAEKLAAVPSRTCSPSTVQTDALLEPRPRHRSLGSIIAPWSGRRSSESASDGHSGPAASQPSFEVTNRPARTRRASGNSLAAFSDPRPTHTPRNLSDMSWLERRRSLTTVVRTFDSSHCVLSNVCVIQGEIDYALKSLNRKEQDPATPATTAMDMMSTNGLMQPTPRSSLFPEMPGAVDSVLHILFHAVLLGLCGLTLSALWLRAPVAAFAVFLVWTVVMYAAIFMFSWYGRPRISILSAFISRLRGVSPHTAQPVPTTPTQSRSLSASGSEYPFPTDGRGPYLHHQPPFRTTLSAGLDHEYPGSMSHEHGMTDVDDDDNEDEDARQRRIEEEMSRRDVSIVTVPRRKLFLTNPEERHT